VRRRIFDGIGDGDQAQQLPIRSNVHDARSVLAPGFSRGQQEARLRSARAHSLRKFRGCADVTLT